MPQRKLKPQPAKIVRAFRSNKAKVSYGGSRWRLVLDKGTWLFVERRGVAQWIPARAAK